MAFPRTRGVERPVLRPIPANLPGALLKPFSMFLPVGMTRKYGARRITRFRVPARAASSRTDAVDREDARPHVVDDLRDGA